MIYTIRCRAGITQKVFTGPINVENSPQNGYLHHTDPHNTLRLELLQENFNSSPASYEIYQNRSQVVAYQNLWRKIKTADYGWLLGAGNHSNKLDMIDG